MSGKGRGRLGFVQFREPKARDLAVHPHLTWVREGLGILNEGNFETIAPFFVDEALDMCQGFFTSKPVEEQWQRGRKLQRHSESNKISPSTLWADGLGITGLIERWDLPTVQTTPEDKQVQQPFSMKASVFYGDLHKWSQGDDELETIKGTSSWPSPSPQTFQTSPLVYEFAMQLGDPMFSLPTWLSLLVPTGSILRLLDKKTFLFIIHAGCYGLVGLKTQLTPVQDDTFIVTLTADRVLLSMTSFQGFRAATVTFDPPCKWPGRNVIVPSFRKKGFMSILRLSAYQGFRQMRVPYMKKLAASLDIPVFMDVASRPATERPIMEALAAHVLGADATSEVLKQAWAYRSRHASREEVALLAEYHAAENKDEEHLLEPEDLRLLEKLEEDNLKERERRAASQRASGHSRSAPQGAASSSDRPNGDDGGAPRPPAIALHSRECWSASDAKAFLPAVRDCYITKDDILRKRWQVYYPCHTPPRSTSKTYSVQTGFADIRALKFCLTWVWQKHQAHTGEACPFDIDEV